MVIDWLRGSIVWIQPHAKTWGGSIASPASSRRDAEYHKCLLNYHSISTALPSFYKIQEHLQQVSACFVARFFFRIDLEFWSGLDTFACFLDPISQPPNRRHATPALQQEIFLVKKTTLSPLLLHRIRSDDDNVLRQRILPLLDRPIATACLVGRVAFSISGPRTLGGACQNLRFAIF